MAFFLTFFKGISVAKNCLRPESAPLKGHSVTQQTVVEQMLCIFLSDNN